LGALRGIELPETCDWPALSAKSGTDLTDHYVDVLRTLGRQPGILGDIFAGETLQVDLGGGRVHEDS